MNIALINVVGIEGSTGKIVSKLAANYISKGHNCKVFHGRGERLKDGIHVKHGTKLDTILHYGMARITDKEGFYSTYFTKKILKDLYEFNPERIIISNLHGHWLNIPLFINGIVKTDAKISWLMADEFPFTARCEYTQGCERYRCNCIGCTRYKNITEQYRAKQDYYEKILPRTVFSSVKFIVDSARASSLLNQAKFDIKNTGIDVDFYHPVDAASLRKRLGISDDEIVLLDVAPYSNKRKGVGYFLNVARMLEKDRRFRFVNVGYDGDGKALPSNYIAIPYVSNQEELREYYSAADAYVCTSTQDALPNACVEAMSCGTPLIAFNVSGMPYMADYPTLKLVSEISADQLAVQIKQSKKKSKAIENSTRAVAIDRYAFTHFADAILQDFQ